MEFESKIAKAKSFNEVRQLVLQYETIFDKSIYVLHLGRLAEKDLDEQRRHTILIGEGQEKVELPKNQVIITNPKSNNLKSIKPVPVSTSGLTSMLFARQ